MKGCSLESGIWMQNAECGIIEFIIHRCSALTVPIPSPSSVVYEFSLATVYSIEFTPVSVARR